MIEIRKNVRKQLEFFQNRRGATPQLSTVNCQFGEAGKFQFTVLLREPDKPKLDTENKKRERKNSSRDFLQAASA